MIFKYVLFNINGDTILELALRIPKGTASPGDPDHGRNPTQMLRSVVVMLLG